MTLPSWSWISRAPSERLHSPEHLIPTFILNHSPATIAGGTSHTTMLVVWGVTVNDVDADASGYEVPFFTKAGHTATHVWDPIPSGAFTTRSLVSFTLPSNLTSSRPAISSPAWSVTESVCPRRSRGGAHVTAAINVRSAPASTASGET